jgi:hypothetical protein
LRTNFGRTIRTTTSDAGRRSSTSLTSWPIRLYASSPSRWTSGGTTSISTRGRCSGRGRRPGLRRSCSRTDERSGVDSGGGVAPDGAGVFPAGAGRTEEHVEHVEGELRRLALEALRLLAGDDTALEQRAALERLEIELSVMLALGVHLFKVRRRDMAFGCWRSVEHAPS